MHVSVLGPLRVERTTGPVEIRGAKERLLLARLVAAGGRVVTSAELVDTLWGGSPPPSAAKSLQTFVVRLRNALEPDRSGAPTVLVTEGPGYRLALDPGLVDAERFARLAAAGHRALADGRPEAAAATLDEALSLWRGPAYSGVDGTEVVLAEARRLEELQLTALEDRMAAELALGRADAAVPELERMAATHPLRERRWELLVTALYRAGRQGEALRAYERARAHLADELGVDPGAALRGVHARVLAHDPSLGRPSHRASVPAGLRPPSGAAGLVGRDVELDRLCRAWTAALRGEGPGVLVVRGPRGAGASALAAALAAEVAREGGRVAYRAPGLDQLGDAGSPGAPLLLVLDHVEEGDAGAACEPRPTLVLHLAGHLAPVPGGAPVVDLEPLSRDAVREIAAEHLRPDELLHALDEVVARSHGWPGAVHEVAGRLARDRARRVVEAAAHVTSASSAELATARSELAHGIARLRERTVGDGHGDPHDCPWRGLASYDVEDARWFAGRDRLTAELTARLAGTRLLALVGASGAGKSSVLRAGLLASLAADALPGSSGWRVITVRPGAHPMQALVRAALGAPSPADADTSLARLLAGDDTERVVVAVDQFEEVWTLCGDDTERRQFLDTLTQLASDPDSVVTVVIAVRADRVGDLAEHAELRALVGDGTVLVGPMTPAEVRRAVERPAAAAGLELDDGLADTVVADAGDEPGLLPLLSTALAELWQRRDAHRLTYAAYVGLGGLDGAISTLAEEVWAGLTLPQQELARRLLLRLAGPGEGAEVTRRRVPRSEVASLGTEVRDVVDELVAGRLLTTSDDHLEVAHEALFREWPRLRAWLAEDSAGRAVRGRLAVAAAEWDAEGRDAALLWSGTRLASGIDVAASNPSDLTPTEQAFLEAGRAAVDADRREAEQRAATTARQNRRLRWLLAGLALVLVGALVAGMLAVRAREDAQQASTTAEARRLAATALTLDYPDTAMLAAVEATRLEDSPETYGSMLTLLARQPDVIHRVRSERRYLRMAVSSDAATVFVSDNAGGLTALDSASGAVRWHRETGGQIANLTAVPGSPDVIGSWAKPPGAVLTRFRGGDGSSVWELDGQELVDAGTSPDAWLGWAGLTPDRRLIAETDGAIIEVGLATGRPGQARRWPEETRFSSQSFLVWPDGRVSRAVPDSDPQYSVVVDPTGRRPDGRITGVPLAASPDGRRLVVADPADGVSTIRLVDLVTRDELARVDVDGYASSASWSDDGARLLVTAGEVVNVLDDRLRPVRQLLGHSGAAMDARFAGPDTVWTAGRDGTSVAFDLSGRRTPVVTLPGEGASVGDVPRTGDIAVGVQIVQQDANTAWLLDATSGRRVAQVPVPTSADRGRQPTAAAVTPDGRTGLVALDAYDPDTYEPIDDEGSILVVDTAARAVTRTIELPWPVFALDVTPDGRRAVVNTLKGVAVVDLASGTPSRLVERADEIGVAMALNVAVSPDGRSALVGRVGDVAVVDLDTLEVRAEREVTPDPDTKIGGVTWSADGRRVVVGDFAGWVHVLDAGDLSDAAPRRSVTGGFVIAADIGSGGRILATLGSDGDLMLWDTATWRPYGAPVTDGHAWGVLSARDDEDLVRVLHEDGTTVEVSTDRTSWLRSACAAAGRDLTADEAAVITPGRPPGSTCSDLR